MANRKIEMYEYREIIYRLRKGQSERSIAREGSSCRTKTKVIKKLAHQEGWLLDVDLPSDILLAEFFESNAKTQQVSLSKPYTKEISPKEIKKIRKCEKISQPVLAMFLNVSPSTVKHWERGEKHPRGAALKLLNIVAEKGLQAVA